MGWDYTYQFFEKSYFVPHCSIALRHVVRDEWL